MWHRLARSLTQGLTHSRTLSLDFERYIGYRIQKSNAVCEEKPRLTFDSRFLNGTNK